MEVNVKTKYLRISPRKLRPVVNYVRGMNALEARDKLKFQMNKSSDMVLNLLNSALSIVKDSEIEQEKFRISSIMCGDGPRLKRGTPVSKGRMAPIVKRQSHLVIVLSDVVKEKKEAKKIKAVKE